MGFETFLLLCGVPRRPGWLSACACVCVVLAHLQGVRLCPGALAGRSGDTGSPGGRADVGKGSSVI